MGKKGRTESQSTDSVLMVEPVAFYANPETMGDNQFQDQTLAKASAQQAVLKEFKDFRAALEKRGVRVTTYKDIKENDTPDSIYPNNWFSTHAGSILCLYALRAQSRRRERRADIISDLKTTYPNVFDLSAGELSGKFLEGTGSMVLDRPSKIAYAGLSPRTDRELLEKWCSKMGYRMLAFSTGGKGDAAIYHTNVMLAIGSGYAVVCLDVISGSRERALVSNMLNDTGHELVVLSAAQMNEYCANIIELKGRESKTIIVMSKRAEKNFTAANMRVLERYASPLAIDLSNIENLGGGGARCMLAELF